MKDVSGIIGSAVSAVISGRRSKVIQRIEHRPFLSVKMILPPNDGIGDLSAKYKLANIGNGDAIKIEIVEVYRTIDDLVQEGSPFLNHLDYSVLKVCTEIEFSVTWNKQISQESESDWNNEDLMGILIRENAEAYSKSVTDNIIIQYNDLLGNRYQQVATVSYLHPDKPRDVKEDISEPELIF